MKKIIDRNRDTFIFVILLILITCLGGFLRFYQIGKLSFWIDEAATAFDIQGDFKTFVDRLNSLANMRFYYILAYFWTKLFPNASDGTLRALSAIFSTATIPVVFLLGKEILEDKPKANTLGLLAAFLTAINAFNIQYAQEFRSYSLVVLLTLLSTLILVKYVENCETKIKWLIWYILISAAAIYSHMYAIFIIGAHAISLLVLLADKQNYSKIFIRFFIGCLAIAILLVPMILSALQKGALLSWISEPSLEMLKNFFIVITGYRESILIVVYLLLSLGGFWAGLRPFNNQNLLTRWKLFLIACGLIIPVTSAYIFSIVVSPIFIPRYLIYVVPYLAILAASGIVALAGIKTNLKVMSIGLKFTMVITISMVTFVSFKGLQKYYADFNKQEWRLAAQLLSEKCSDSLRIYYHGTGERGIRYYNNSLDSQKNTWANRLVYNPASFANSKPPFPSQYEQVCLVLSLTNTESRMQNAELIKSIILEQLPTVSDYKYFGVEIYIYTP